MKAKSFMLGTGKVTKVIRINEVSWYYAVYSDMILHHEYAQLIAIESGMI